MMVRKLIRQISRFGRLTAGAIVLLGMALGGTIYAARAPNRYACLRFDNNILVDLNMGVSTRETRPQTMLGIGSTLYSRALSPDGKSVAYLGPGTRSSRLFVGPVGGEAKLIKDNVDFLAPNAWSPDSKRLVYVWWWNDGRSHAGMINADGTHEQTIVTLGDPSFVSWSSDGQYIALLAGDSTRRQLGFWSFPGLRPVILPAYVSLIENIAWERHGHRLAYVWRDDAQNTWLSFASPDQSNDLRFLLPQNSYDHRLSWSPNNRYVAVRYYSQWPQWRFDVYGVNGEADRDIAQTAPPGDSLTGPGAVWAPDGHSLIFVLQQSNYHDLLSYNLDEHRYETLAARLPKSPSYAPGERRMALYRQQSPGEKISIDLMDVDGQNQIPLITEADDAGDPYWSLDGQWIAAVWATGQQGTRVVRLTWARADGADRHDLVDNFWDVRDLRWLSDHKSLAYVAWRHDGYSVEVLNLETGAHIRLLDKLSQVAGLEQDVTSGLITFWWRTGDGHAGTDGYQIDDKQGYRLKVSGAIDGRRLFWSPDGSIAALKLGLRGNESLQLASRDGATLRVVRSGLTGLGDPLWSPDGSMVAFTQADRNSKGGQITLEVIRADGTELQHFDEFRSFYTNLMWTRCD